MCITTPCYLFFYSIIFKLNSNIYIPKGTALCFLPSLCFSGYGLLRLSLLFSSPAFSGTTYGPALLFLPVPYGGVGQVSFPTIRVGKAASASSFTLTGELAEPPTARGMQVKGKVLPACEALALVGPGRSCNKGYFTCVAIGSRTSTEALQHKRRLRWKGALMMLRHIF